MSTSTERRIHLHSLDGTVTFGEQLGRLLVAGETVLLSGDLGAGKTTLTRAVARGLDVPEDYYVSSPSFALLHEYPGRVPLYHMDCYRLDGEDDIEGAGLIEYLDSPAAVCLIEWPDRLGRLRPIDALEVRMTGTGKEKRVLTLTGQKDIWAERLGKLKEEYGN